MAKENALAYKYFQKTLKYVYKSTEVNGIEEQYQTIEFDADYPINFQENSKQRGKSRQHSLLTHHFVIIDKQRNPVYEGLGPKSNASLNLMERKNEKIRQNLQRRRRNLPANPSTPSTAKTTPILKPAIRYPAKHGKNHPNRRRPYPDTQDSPHFCNLTFLRAGNTSKPPKKQLRNKKLKDILEENT